MTCLTVKAIVIRYILEKYAGDVVRQMNEASE
jgi:hypothetical protein